MYLQVSDCVSTLAFRRAQLRFSRKAKGKILISAINEVAVASLFTTKASVCEARSEAHSVANSKVTSLKGKELLHSTKAPSAEIASPHDKAFLT